MSPLGIQRTVAIVAVLSPFIFIPSIFKDVVFIVMGILLFISTLDLKKKKLQTHHTENHHTEQVENTA